MVEEGVRCGGRLGKLAVSTCAVVACRHPAETRPPHVEPPPAPDASAPHAAVAASPPSRPSPALAEARAERAAWHAKLAALPLTQTRHRRLYPLHPSSPPGRLGEVRASEGVSLELVARTLLSHYVGGPPNECFRNALGIAPTLDGLHLTVRFAIVSTGLVPFAEATDTNAPAALASCVVRSLERFQFPRLEIPLATVEADLYFDQPPPPLPRLHFDH